MLILTDSGESTGATGNCAITGCTGMAARYCDGSKNVGPTICELRIGKVGCVN